MSGRAGEPPAQISRRSVVAGLGLLSLGKAWAADPGSAATFAQTALEAKNGVVPAHAEYPPGNPRRYGAVGGGWAHDDTAALQTCIDCNKSVTFNAGDTYGVTTITFPAGGPDVVNFNGAFVVGIASTPTDCIVAIKSSFTTFYGYQVFGLGNGRNVPNPNPNYACATWWYNSSGGSQYNTFFGMIHSTCVRAVVYGALPGTKPSGGLQSENSIFGFRTIGCSNPFYSNAQAGFIHFSEPIFYAGFESWTVPRVPSARALENYSGGIFAQGGELEYATSASGFAADLQGCILQGMNFETAAPIQILGDGVQIVGGSLYNTSSVTSEFKVAKGATGSLSITSAALGRGAGAGGFSRQPMIDATDAPDFAVLLQDTLSSEWGWVLAGSHCRLVVGGKPSYMRHRMRLTTRDPNVYLLDSSEDDGLISSAVLDRLGYTMKGWAVNTVSGAKGILGVSTAEGPPGYLPAQLTLSTAGVAQALNADPGSLASLQSGALEVRPRELYWPSCWINNAGAAGASLVANFYGLNGAPVSTSAIADIASIGSRTWSRVEGPLAVPDKAAFMAVGVQADRGSVAFTDLRVRRAG